MANTPEVIYKDDEGNEFGDAPTAAGRYAARAYFTNSDENYDDFAVYAEFEITPRALNDGLTFETDDLTYNEQAQTASVTVEYDGTELEEGEDYTLTCDEQTDAGTFQEQGV